MTTNTTRRAILAGAAAAPAAILSTTLPVDARATDPIFAAMELYRRADAEHGARCEEDDDSEERYAAATEACHAAWDAMRALANTSPTTLAGLAAYLEFVIAETDELGELIFYDRGPDFLRAIALAARRMASTGH
jgi:hypothetical protein